MRALILWADDRSPNLGVRALGSGSAALLRRVHPEAEITYQNFGYRNPHLPLGSLRGITRERLTSRRGMQQWLGSFDVVIDTRGGDSFSDIYGLPRLRMMTAVSEFATQAGVPVILGPQTIGPFVTAQGRLLGRHSLRRAAASMARDTTSADYARSLRRPIDTLTTDVVFALPRPERTTQRDVILNVSGLLWQPSPHVDSAAYRDVITRLYEALLARGRTVALLAHVLSSPALDDDVPAVTEFARSVAPDAEVLIPGDLDEVRRIVGSSRLVIGSRMHACLNALSTGTPAIPLAYSRKFSPLLQDLGWHRTVDLRSDDDPVLSALRHVDDPELTADAHLVGQRAAALLARAEELLRKIT